ncbi:MAG: PorV/PorQ family protein [Elusimicrobiota bacterium]|nr:PorV/PorQ family protein [Elusimicrobiota bacterium]
MRNLAALLALLLATTASAASNEGQAGAQFLKLGSSARAGGMGDAFTAVSDDAYAVHYNPAGLTRLERSQIGGGHTALFQRVTYQSFALAVPFGKEEGWRRHALGLGVLYLGVGDIERRTGDSTNPVGTFGAADSAYSLTYAHGFSESLSVGVTGKHINQSIDTYRGSAFGADLGLLYRLSDGPHAPALGLAVKNAGTRIGYTAAERDPLPTTASVGASFRPYSGKLLVSLEAGKASDADPFGALGLEGRKAFGEGAAAALRFGYNSSRRELGTMSGVSAGAGLSFPKADFDLAWVPFGPLGDSFRFSLLVKF